MLWLIQTIFFSVCKKKIEILTFCPSSGWENCLKSWKCSWDWKTISCPALVCFFSALVGTWYTWFDNRSIRPRVLSPIGTSSAEGKKINPASVCQIHPSILGGNYSSRHILGTCAYAMGEGENSFLTSLAIGVCPEAWDLIASILSCIADIMILMVIKLSRLS